MLKVVKIILLSLYCSLYNACFINANDLSNAIEISARGTRVQAERMKVAAENLANEYTTSGVKGGDPYRRKIVIVKNEYDRIEGVNIAKVKKIDYDKSEFEAKYDPHHPAADDNGYVKMPNVNRVIEKADASEAQRSYEANLGLIEMTHALISKTVEAIK